MDETSIFDLFFIGFALAVTLKIYRNALFPHSDNHWLGSGEAVRDQPEKAQKPVSASDSSPLAQTLETICTASGYSDIETFIEGAKRAYAMIAEAFASGDLRAQAYLLSADVTDTFQIEMIARRTHGHTAKFILIAFDSVEIADARYDAATAQVDVSFATQAVVVVSDRDGHVVAGNPTEVTHLSEVWTFEKSLAPSDANWVLVATREAERDDCRGKNSDERTRA